MHLPILWRRLDFSLMSEGIEGREPLSKEIFIESMKYNEILVKDKQGKYHCDFKKIFWARVCFLKKVGFPINMSRIVKYKTK